MRSVGLLLALALPTGVAAQAGRSNVTPTQDTTSGWCQDATTFCWNPKGDLLAGLRFVFEPQLGVLIQTGDNKFDDTNFSSLNKLGLATNLFGRSLGAQLLFIYPSTVHFDEQSENRVLKIVADTVDGKVDVEWGITLGITALDGLLSIGWGAIKYDRRDFRDPDTLKGDTFSDSFYYINIQAVEAVKGAIKNLRRQ